MKSFRVIIFLLLLPVSLLFAAPYDVIPATDPILDDLRYLSLESGNTFLSFTPPFSPAEIEQFLDNLDLSLLSQPARDAYFRIKNRISSPEARLSFSAGIFSAQISLNATLEARTRFNTDINWYPLYPDIPPLLSFPITFFFADVLQIYIEPSIGATPKYYNNADTFGVNIPFEYNDFEATQPLRAFAAAGGSWWNFQLGRDRLFWGTGNTGSLSFSDNSDYFEFARISFFSQYFKYSLLVNQMPLDLDIENNNNIVAQLPPDALTRTMQRYFYLHRIDANFFDRVSLGVMEGVMVGNSPLEIRYLNPLMLFHSLFSWFSYAPWGEDVRENEAYMNGSFLSIEVNWNITKSLAAYGQFAMNEFSLSVETQADPNQPPNGLGYLAGLQYSHFFDNWASTFFLEFIYTDPYLYLNPSPFASLIQMRFSMTGLNYYYMGYPRDTIALTLGARFFNQDTLSLSGEFTWLSKGAHDKDGLKYDWQKGEPALSERTPSGIAENKFILALSANWKLLPYLSLNGSIAGIYALNSKHESGANTAGGQAAVSVKFQY